MKDRESVTTNGRAVFYAAMWDDLRQAAMNKGWALALHGSLSSDMDIMAMPWTKDAAHKLDMILALKKCFDKPKSIRLHQTEMPNNRLVYTLTIWADFYLDINIIQNSSNSKKESDLPPVSGAVCECKFNRMIVRYDNKDWCNTCGKLVKAN